MNEAVKQPAGYEAAHSLSFRPFQFGLGSIFRVTSIVACAVWVWQSRNALGLLNQYLTNEYATQSSAIIEGIAWLPVPILLGIAAVEIAARAISTSALRGERDAEVRCNYDNHD